MDKKEFIKRINKLDDKSFDKFIAIAEQSLTIIQEEMFTERINTSNCDMTTSEKLKNARKLSGLSQIELAKKLNISCSAIGNIEAGITPSSKEMARKLSEFFKTDTRYWRENTE